MKKIINNPENVLNEMIDGLVKASNNNLRRIEGTDVVVNVNSPIEDKVALVSGGGSGHEPSHAGFIGKGMLDAAVCGSVFTSPTPDQIFEAIKTVDSGKGTLLIIKNYTGDVMNFEMAKDLADMEGINIDYVIVNDDVAVEDSTYTAGRRGVAGTVFVHKIAGAKAISGGSLIEVKNAANKVIDNVRSMGMAISPCTVPAIGKPNFILADNEMEIGTGIHGEPGVKREEMKTADEITDELLNHILNDLDYSNSEVAVMVNGMGSTPLMELYIVNNRVHDVLKEKNIKIYKTFVGEYMTSLEMAGFSITLLKLDDELKKLLDMETDAPAFK